MGTSPVLFDMSKAVPISQANPARKQLFDMSKAVAIPGAQPFNPWIPPTSQPAGDPNGAGATTAQPPTTLQRVAQTAGNLATGVAKGAAHTFLSLSDIGQNVSQWEQQHLPTALTGQIPGQPTATQNRAYIAGLQNKMQPTGGAQKVGYYGEQAGEYLAPSGVEKAAVKGLTAIPSLAKAAPLLRVGAGALSSGLVSGAQGGSPYWGALFGGAGGALGEGLRAAAPKLAESALGVRAVDRAFSANPGQAILDETSGFTPGMIAEQAQARKGVLGALQRGFVQENPRMVSLKEPTDVATSAMQQQANRNAASYIDRLNPLRQQIMIQGEPKGGFPLGVQPRRPPGSLIPMNVPGDEALDLRQGIGNFQSEKPWTGKVSGDPVTNAIKQMYGKLSDNFHTVYPEIAPLDARMHSLFPVADRATSVDLNASTLQRIAGRFAKPTGALTPMLAGAGLGGGVGYQKGGVPGMVGGAVAGLIAPELLASPTAQMGLARGLYRAAPAASRLGAGGAVNLYNYTAKKKP